MKRIITTALIASLLFPINAQAIDYVELWKTDREAYIKAVTCTDEVSREQGLYSDYKGIDELKTTAVTAGASKDIVAEYKKRKAEREKKYSSKTTTSGSLVLGMDELHVIGLPSDPETGYTLPGYYEDVPTTGTDVYGYDDLHVIGTPTRPDGYTAAGRYVK